MWNCWKNYCKACGVREQIRTSAAEQPNEKINSNIWSPRSSRQMIEWWGRRANCSNQACHASQLPSGQTCCSTRWKRDDMVQEQVAGFINVQFVKCFVIVSTPSPSSVTFKLQLLQRPIVEVIDKLTVCFSVWWLTCGRSHLVVEAIVCISALVTHPFTATCRPVD